MMKILLETGHPKLIPMRQGYRQLHLAMTNLSHRRIPPPSLAGVIGRSVFEGEKGWRVGGESGMIRICTVSCRNCGTSELS
jgi:hypothetical protein